MTTRLITVASLSDATEQLHALLDAGRIADAYNLRNDTDRDALRASDVATALDDVWRERGPDSGLPTVLDTPTPVNAPRRAELQVDDRWGAVA